MAHTHDHGSLRYGRAFALGIVLNLGFVVVEFIYGRLAHSLALQADAGHNLSDVLGLVLAWGASRLAQRRPSPRRTYGFRRATILAALINAIVLLFAIGGIAWEAVGRLREPAPIQGSTVMVVAAIGIVVNTLTALLFLQGQQADLNIRGAFLHMAADAGVSFGVVLAGVALLATGWLWLDSVVSLIVAGVILVSTWSLLRDSVDLALDAVPTGVNVPDVQAYLQHLPGVQSVHDLHIWGMSTTETALTAHVVVAEAVLTDATFLPQVTTALHDRFEIPHATLQLERADAPPPCWCSVAV